jgi:hypothetical protein
MTTRAGRHDLLSDRFSTIPACGIVRLRFLGRGGIAAVAVDARETSLVVHVAGKIAGGRRERRLRQRRMTTDAAIDRRLGRGVGRERRKNANRDGDRDGACEQHVDHEDT